MFLISYYTIFIGFAETNVGRLSGGRGYLQSFRHQPILVRLIWHGGVELLLLHHIIAGMHKFNMYKIVLMSYYELLEQKTNNIPYMQAVDEVIKQAAVAMARYRDDVRSADKTKKLSTMKSVSNDYFISMYFVALSNFIFIVS